MKRSLQHAKRGQTLVEYALVLSFISIVAITTLFAMGTNVKGIFTTVSSQMSMASTAGDTSGTGGSGSGSGSGGGSGSPTGPSAPPTRPSGF